jgi:hypothetical protein
VNTRAIIIRLSAFLITLVGCILILEVLVRIFIPQSDLRLGKGHLFRYEPYIDFEGIPHSQGVFAKTEFKTTVVHNQEGFRDIHHEKKNTQNRFRIITLGDSFT